MKINGAVNKLVAIHPEQEEALQQLKHGHGIIQAHVIREGIDLALAKYAHLFPTLLQPKTTHKEL